MKLLSNCFLSLCLLLLNANANDNENKPLINLMIIAKATGMCGTIKQLTAFQESTKMPGGDEFILRFVNTEAARLGKTVPQFLSECQSSIEIYTKTMQSLGFGN
ncbi:hypothetical protein WCX72_03385 [Sulfurimonas sp. HSL1-6]|uniref:hypothetical protein n=1 Tax=Thiomicrolovo immobilis TaxID=3131935 RepID=UPI0031F9AF0B